MHKIKKDFPLLCRSTYLNWAASGLLCEDLLQFRRTHDQQYYEHGSKFREGHHVFLNKVRSAVGQTFGAASDRVVLTPSFSYGFRAFLDSLPSGTSVLVLDRDYPTITGAAHQGDLELHVLKIGPRLEERIMEYLQKKQPQVFAFSIVQYLDGIKLSQVFLQELRQRFPDLLLAADGTQYCGTEPIDFDGSGLDLLGASGYKWLNAGYGNAFLLLSPRYLSYQKSRRYRQSLLEHFEPGHLDTLAFGSLLHMMKEARAAVQPEELLEQARRELGTAGWLSAEVTARPVHGQIFNLRGTQRLLHKLLRHNIICCARGAGIRIGFHRYNTHGDLDHLLEVLHSEQS